MISWYKATPLIVALPDEVVATDPLAHIDRSKVRVRVPHQVIWGLQDKALRPSTRVGLADLCDNVIMHDVPGADHWIIHQKPDEVCSLIQAFVEKHSV